MTSTLLFLFAAAGPAADPALQVAKPTIDKGEVAGGPPLVHTFTLTHGGGAGTVIVTGAEAGCGCIRQDLSRRVLRPGDSSEFTLEINTLTQPDGPGAWAVKLKYKTEPESGPAETGSLDLAVVAKLKREVSISPPQVAFSTAKASEQVLTVTDHRPGKKLTVLKAASANPHLTATVGAATDRNGIHSQTVTLTLSENAPVGQTDEMVVLTTDDPNYAEVRVPVRVVKKTVGAVNAFPETLTLRTVKGQAEVSGLVQVRADGKPVAIAKTECATGGVSVKASTGAGSVQTVRVTIAPAIAGRSGSATVTVTLSEPAGQILSLPVRWGD